MKGSREVTNIVHVYVWTDGVKAVWLTHQYQYRHH